MAGKELIPDREINKLVGRYRSFPLPAVSYATVRDYCDSVDHVGALSWMNGDLKDQQRCWILKAILGNVPKGSRLLEIGAGEPFVADILSRAGYDVTIVDPYDGSGNGPTQAKLFVARYPALDIHVDWFTPDANLTGNWDCFYSISVLEHIPLNQLPNVFAGMEKFGAQDYRSIHAVDHVLQGNGDVYHRQMLGVVAKGCGVSDDGVTEVLEKAKTDTETYFLSAEGHNRWRGKSPYDTFPMRRCISVQFCV